MGIMIEMCKWPKAMDCSGVYQDKIKSHTLEGRSEKVRRRYIHQSVPSFIILLSIIFGLCSLLYASVHPVHAINSVLDLKGTFPYLLDNSSGIERVIEPRDYMDFENLYAPNETYKLRQTAQGRNYHLIKAFDFANYYQSDYWHYSRREDLIQSAQPVANEHQCSQHLDWIEQQLNKSDGAALFHPGEQHINLMTLVDAYGHPETITYYGHGYWLGSYHECTRVSIDVNQYQVEECANSGVERAEECKRRLDEGKQQQQQQQQDTLKFRYCVGKARDVDWPKDDNYVPRISYKVGLCLPEACETRSFERNRMQIQRLMRYNLPEYTKQRISLTEIYCLPDARSPIRQLPLSARIFLGFCSLWLATLVFATIIYSCHKRHQRDLREIRRAREQLNAGEGRQLLLEPGENRATKAPPPPTPVTANGSSGSGSSSTRHHPHHLSTDLYANNLSSSSGFTSAPKMSLQILSTPEPLIMRTDDDDDNEQQQQRRHVSASASALTAPSLVMNNNIITQEITYKEEEARKSPSRSNLSHRSGASSVASLSAWLAESPLIIKTLQAMSIKETLREFQQPPRMLDAPGAAKRLRVNLNALDAIKCLCCILVIFGHIIFIHMQHLSNIIHTIELSYEIYPRLLCAFFNFVDTFFIISGMLTAYFIFKRFNRQSFASPITWLSISLLRLLRLSPVYILVLWFIKTTSVYMTHGPIWDYGTDDKSIKGLCMNDHWWKSILYLGNVGTMQPLCILPAWSIIVDAQYSLVVPAIIFLIFSSKRLGYLFLVLATIVSTTKMTIQLANQTAVKTSDMAKIRLHVYPLISRFAAEFYNTAWNRIGPVAIGIFGGHMLYLYETGSIRRWPQFMRGLAFKFVLLLHVFIFLLPTIGLYFDNPETAQDTDTTIFILSNATIKPIWSIINTILLLRLVTDLRSHSVLVRLMSHNIWHCLGKLCFTSYLIHYEIILTMLKSRQEGLIDPNWSNALREFSAVFLISTVISYVIYILYEAPMNKLIMLVFAKHNGRLRNGSNRQHTTNNNNNNNDNNNNNRDNIATSSPLTSQHDDCNLTTILKEQTQSNSDRNQDIDHSAMVDLHKARYQDTTNRPS